MATPAGLGGGSGTGTLLLASCIARVVAVLWTFTYVSDPEDDDFSFGVPKTLFFAMAGAAGVLMVLQRPWSGKTISGRQWRKVGFSGTALATTLLLWIIGMRACGPLRALLMDGAELPLFYILAVASGKETRSRSKSRGAIIMLLAYVLLIYDASGRAPKGQTALEKTKVGMQLEESVDRLRDNAQDTVNTVIEKADEAAKRIQGLRVGDNKEEADQVDVDDRLVPRSDDEDAVEDNADEVHKGDPDENKDDAERDEKRQDKNGYDKDEKSGDDKADDEDGDKKDPNDDGEAAKDADLKDEDDDAAQGAKRRLLAKDVSDSYSDKDDKSDDTDYAAVKAGADPVPGYDYNKIHEDKDVARQEEDEDDDDFDDTNYNRIPGGLESEIGVVLVLIASLLNQVTRGYTRKLATELGGAKRQFALTVTAGSLAVAPLMIVSELYTGGPFPTIFSVGIGNTIALSIIGFLWLILPYYIRAVITSRLDQTKLLRGGMMVTFTVACVAWLVFGAGSRAGGMSVTLFGAFCLLVIGINMMTLEPARESSSLPFDRRDERAD